MWQTARDQDWINDAHIGFDGVWGTEQVVRASGFDVHDPDRRYPVHNPQAEQILAAKGKKALSRAEALLQARSGQSNVKDRVLGFLIFLFSLLPISEPWASGNPHLDAKLEKQETPDLSLQLFKDLPTVEDPILIMVLIAALLISTFISQSLQFSELLILKRIYTMLKKLDRNEEPDQGHRKG